MNCPVCKSTTLFRKQIENQLLASECGTCGGRWIASYQYWKWKDQSGGRLPNPPAPQAGDVPVADTPGAKLCPECGHFLRRYPVGDDLDFSLERCSNCGGMWFDKNEWEALKARGLHNNVHNIFSEIWQSRLRDAAHQQAVEQMYRDKFGAEDYEKIKQIKEWISGHPHEAELKAFLNL